MIHLLSPNPEREVVAAPTQVAAVAADLAVPGRRRRAWKLVVIGLVLLGLTGGIWAAALRSSGFRRQLALSFTHRPNNFAELYVANPDSFATSYARGGAYSVRLGVTNDSSVDQSYTLVATSTAHGSPGALTTQTMRVPAERSQMVTMSMHLPVGTKVVVISMSGHPHTVLRLRVREVASVDH